MSMHSTQNKADLYSVVVFPRLTPCDPAAQLTSLPTPCPHSYACCGRVYSHAPRLTFDAIDTDGDGCLDKDEFVSGAVRLGMNQAEASKLFAQIDVNGDGVVTRKEFASALGSAWNDDDGDEGEDDEGEEARTKGRRGRGKGERKKRYQDVRSPVHAHGGAGRLTFSSRSLTESGDGEYDERLGIEVSSPVHVPPGQRGTEMV